MIVHCCILNELLISVAGRRRKLRNDHLHADGLLAAFLFTAIVAACDLLLAQLYLSEAKARCLGVQVDI